MIDRLKPQTLKAGSRVCLTFDLTRQGTLVTLGPEVSEVRFDDGARRFFSNTLLCIVKA